MKAWKKVVIVLSAGVALMLVTSLFSLGGWQPNNCKYCTGGGSSARYGFPFINSRIESDPTILQNQNVFVVSPVPLIADVIIYSLISFGVIQLIAKRRRK